MKSEVDSYRRATRTFSGQNRFLGSWNRGTSINTSCTTHKRRAPQGEMFVFFSKTFLKLHLKWEFNPWMHTNKAIFSKIRVLFVYFQKRQGKARTLPLSSCTCKLIYVLKSGWYSINFFFMTMSKFSKNWIFTLKSWASHG